MLELNDLPTISKETNLIITALVTNEKGLFLVAIVPDLGREPTFKGGLH